VLKTFLLKNQKDQKNRKKTRLKEVTKKILELCQFFSFWQFSFLSTSQVENCPFPTLCFQPVSFVHPNKKDNENSKKHAIFEIPKKLPSGSF